MRRIAGALTLAVALFAVPGIAHAAQGSGAISVDEIAGVATLIAAVLLLVTATALERVARGSAIADNISYVVGACICLGASALGRWVARLVPQGVTVEQIALSSDALTLVAITLFSVYFLRVRSALRRFLDLAGGTDVDLARAQAGEAPDEGAGIAGGSVSAEKHDG